MSRPKRTFQAGRRLVKDLTIEAIQKSPEVKNTRKKQQKVVKQEKDLVLQNFPKNEFQRKQNQWVRHGHSKWPNKRRPGWRGRHVIAARAHLEEVKKAAPHWRKDTNQIARLRCWPLWKIEKGWLRPQAQRCGDMPHRLTLKELATAYFREDEQGRWRWCCKAKSKLRQLVENRDEHIQKLELKEIISQSASKRRNCSRRRRDAQLRKKEAAAAKAPREVAVESFYKDGDDTYQGGTGLVDDESRRHHG